MCLNNTIFDKATKIVNLNIRKLIAASDKSIIFNSPIEEAIGAKNIIYS